MIPVLAPAHRPRLVLDTNVCLDLFVFQDPGRAALLAALESGAVEAVTRADCRAEFLYVLQYPHLKLTEATRPLVAARFDALIQLVAPAPAAQPLPACSDREDQKFLELARDAQADMLLTKDKALLKLAKRLSKAGLFRVIVPEAWPGISQDATPK